MFHKDNICYKFFEIPRYIYNNFPFSFRIRLVWTDPQRFEKLAECTYGIEP